MTIKLILKKMKISYYTKIQNPLQNDSFSTYKNSKPFSFYNFIKFEIMCQIRHANKSTA